MLYHSQGPSPYHRPPLSDPGTTGNSGFPKKAPLCLRSQTDRLPLLLQSPGAKGEGGLSERRRGSQRGGGAPREEAGLSRGGWTLREEAGCSKPLTGFPVRSSPISSQSQPQICSSSAEPRHPGLFIMVHSFMATGIYVLLSHSPARVLKRFCCSFCCEDGK